MLLIELVIDASADESSVYAISLVDKPAIEVDFVKLEAQKIATRFVAEDKQIVTGPVLIPYKKIYRSASSMGLQEDAMVFFSEETVRKMAHSYITNILNNSVTLEHEAKTDQVTMLESWVIEDPQYDKAFKLGFELPTGTWMSSFKVHDENLWKEVKEGNFNGFSIEVDNLIGVLKGETLIMHEDDGRQILPEELHPHVIKRLDEIGQTEESLRDEGFEIIGYEEDLARLEQEIKDLGIDFAIESTVEDHSALDSAFYAIRYKYSGPRDDKNRAFCAQVLGLDKYYRREDIMMMELSQANPDFGTYNIFDFKGSFGCRHKWDRVLFQRTVATTGNQIIPGHKKTDSIPAGFIPYGDDRATQVNPAPRSGIPFSSNPLDALLSLIQEISGENIE
jgi:hypothetical protein